MQRIVVTGNIGIGFACWAWRSADNREYSCECKEESVPNCEFTAVYHAMECSPEKEIIIYSSDPLLVRSLNGERINSQYLSRQILYEGICKAGGFKVSARVCERDMPSYARCVEMMRQYEKE